MGGFSVRSFLEDIGPRLVYIRLCCTCADCWTYHFGCNGLEGVITGFWVWYKSIGYTRSTRLLIFATWQPEAKRYI